MTEKSSSSSGPSATGLLLGVASIGAGAYHGYRDAHGIPFQKENLEWALTYGPAIVQGSLGAIGGGIVGLIGGGFIGAASGWRDGVLEKIVKGIAAEAGLDGAIGGIKGGVQTLIGYGIGYLAGYSTK